MYPKSSHVLMTRVKPKLSTAKDKCWTYPIDSHSALPPFIDQRAEEEFQACCERIIDSLFCPSPLLFSFHLLLLDHNLLDLIQDWADSTLF